MQELLGKKIGMTQIIDGNGFVLPVTVIEVGPCYIIRTKTTASDGYNAVQIGYGNIKEKKVNKPMQGIFKKAGVSALNSLHEFRVENVEGYSNGQKIGVELFKEGELIDVSGTSIGKGFSGSVKRHHFNRGPMSHGSKSHRLPGSSGAGTSPGNIKKGLRRAGQLGNCTITTKNISIAKIYSDKNLLLLNGSVPGSKGSVVVVRKKAK